MSDQHKTVSLFDVVYLCKASTPNEDLKNRMLEILQSEKSRNGSVQRSNRGGFQSDDLCRNEIAPKLLNAFVGDITNYLKSYKAHRSFRVNLTGLWINSNLKNHFNMPHNHSPDFSRECGT